MFYVFGIKFVNMNSNELENKSEEKNDQRKI